MSHPVSPTCQRLILYFRCFKGLRSRNIPLVGARGWNTNDKRGWLAVAESSWTSDDVGFIKAALAEVRERLPHVPAQYSYAIGYGLGGGLVYKLACEASDVLFGFAAMGVSWADPSAGFGASWRAPQGASSGCAKENAPRPFWAGIGSEDETLPPMRSAVADWQRFAGEVNGCARDTLPELAWQSAAGDVECRQIPSGCSAPQEHCTYDGMPKAFPGAADAQANDPGYDIARQLSVLPAAWSLWKQADEARYCSAISPKRACQKCGRASDCGSGGRCIRGRERSCRSDGRPSDADMAKIRASAFCAANAPENPCGKCNTERDCGNTDADLVTCNKGALDGRGCVDGVPGEALEAGEGEPAYCEATAPLNPCGRCKSERHCGNGQDGLYICKKGLEKACKRALPGPGGMVATPPRPPVSAPAAAAPRAAPRAVPNAATPPATSAGVTKPPNPAVFFGDQATAYCESSAPMNACGPCKSEKHCGNKNGTLVTCRKGGWGRGCPPKKILSHCDADSPKNACAVCKNEEDCGNNGEALSERIALSGGDPSDVLRCRKAPQGRGCAAPFNVPQSLLLDDAQRISQRISEQISEHISEDQFGGGDAAGILGVGGGLLVGVSAMVLVGALGVRRRIPSRLQLRTHRSAQG